MATQDGNPTRASGPRPGRARPDPKGEQSYTIKTTPAMRADIDAVKTMIGASTRAEAIRRMAHATRLLLEADSTQNDRITVLDQKGRRKDVIV